MTEWWETPIPNKPCCVVCREYFEPYPGYERTKVHLSGPGRTGVMCKKCLEKWFTESGARR